MKAQNLPQIKRKIPRCPERLKVKHRLELAGYRREDVALVAGVSGASVSRWFHGLTNSETVEEAIELLLSQAEAA